MRHVTRSCVAVPLVFLGGCAKPPEERVRELLAGHATGVVRLPPGRIEISRELTLAPGARDLEIAGGGAVLHAAPGFQGRAVLVAEGAQRVRLRGFAIDGGRDASPRTREMVPPENALRVWYAGNGILADRVEGLEIEGVRIGNVAGLAVLVSRSSQIRIRGVRVENSGSRNWRGRNNLSGGILIEEGSRDFQVRDSAFRAILGNALWTHSLRTSPRLVDGVFAGNTFDTVGRDAIQVGHATRVRVENNSGRDIGYPPDAVDVENGGTPVAIDTAGNVDHSVYADNSFEEVNGKCIDLDGFHDGEVRANTCTNRRAAAEYPYGHFGMVMNNTDPEVRSRNIVVSGNTIDGAKFGGLFLMGMGHTVEGNRFLHLNLAGCDAGAPTPGCVYQPGEPRMLESGIYLGRGVARLEETRGNVIRANTITGRGMRSRCIAAGRGVTLTANRVEANACSDAPLAEPRP